MKSRGRGPGRTRSDIGRCWRSPSISRLPMTRWGSSSQGSRLRGVAAFRRLASGAPALVHDYLQKNLCQTGSTRQNCAVHHGDVLTGKSCSVCAQATSRGSRSGLHGEGREQANPGPTQERCYGTSTSEGLIAEAFSNRFQPRYRHNVEDCTAELVVLPAIQSSCC